MLNRALKLLRTYHQLKQIDLAKRLEISNSYLSEIESGEKTPGIDLLEKYAVIFKMPASSILLFSASLSLPSPSSWVSLRLIWETAASFMNLKSMKSSPEGRVNLTKPSLATCRKAEKHLPNLSPHSAPVSEWKSSPQNSSPLAIQLMSPSKRLRSNIHVNSQKQSTTVTAVTAITQKTNPPQAPAARVQAQPQASLMPKTPLPNPPHTAATNKM